MDKGFPGPSLTSVCVCDTLSLSQTACMVAFSQRRGGGGGSVTLLMLYPLILKLPIHFLLRATTTAHKHTLTPNALIANSIGLRAALYNYYRDSNFRTVCRACIWCCGGASFHSSVFLMHSLKVLQIYSLCPRTCGTIILANHLLLFG
jgi:hypothetical protein